MAGPSGRRVAAGNGTRDAWSARNSAKYGAGSDGGASRGYDPEVGRAAGTGDDDVGDAPKRGCTIM